MTLRATLICCLTLLLLASGIVTAAAALPDTSPSFPEALAFEDYGGRRKMLEANPLPESFVGEVNAFAYRTAAELFGETEENTSYSPLSLYFALNLISEGAKGDTREVLLELLDPADPDRLAVNAGNLFRRLYTDNEIGKMKIANSMWLADSFNGMPVHFQPDFQRIAAEQFYAEPRRVNFKSDEAGQAISDWIALQTDGKLVPEIKTNPEQILTMINTIDFYDEWIHRFSDAQTAPDTFYLADGHEVEADFMHAHFGSAGFDRGENFTRAGLQLKNGGSMVFILPDEGVSPQTLLRDADAVRVTFEGGESLFGDVRWQIPLFDFSGSLRLERMLNALGLGILFTAEADFSGMVDHLAFLSSVEQQATVAIDERGVSAAAFTQIDYVGAAPPQDSADMLLNRPFIFGIYGNEHALLFIGIVDNPAEH